MLIDTPPMVLTGSNKILSTRDNFFFFFFNISVPVAVMKPETVYLSSKQVHGRVMFNIPLRLPCCPLHHILKDNLRKTSKI